MADRFEVGDVTTPARRVKDRGALGWIKQGGKLGNGIRKFLKRRRKEAKKMEPKNYTPAAVVDLEVYDVARNRKKGNKAMVTSGVALVAFGIARTLIEYLLTLLPGEIARTIDEPTKDWAANIAAVFMAGLAAKFYAQIKNWIETKDLPRPDSQPQEGGYVNMKVMILTAAIALIALSAFGCGTVSDARERLIEAGQSELADLLGKYQAKTLEAAIANATKARDKLVVEKTEYEQEQTADTLSRPFVQYQLAVFDNRVDQINDDIAYFEAEKARAEAVGRANDQEAAVIQGIIDNAPAGFSDTVETSRWLRIEGADSSTLLVHPNGTLWRIVTTGNTVSMKLAASHFVQ